MKPAALALMALGALSACSLVERHTDKQAAMASMTFSPEKCEPVGPMLSYCGGDRALPSVTESGNTNDAQVVRGICQQGFHYETGGCQKG
jgi:hypothetical protein